MLDYINVLAAATAEAAPGSANPLESIIKTFHVEGWLLGAQIVNIVIVLLVLKKFAFGPILKTLEERRARIISGEEKIKLIERQLADSVETTAAAIATASARPLPSGHSQYTALPAPIAACTSSR